MADPKPKDVLLDPLFNDNPIALQVLGICSALAVTTKMQPTVVMCLAVIFVAHGVRHFLRQRRHVPRVAYGDTQTAEIPPGMTLLEALRALGYVP